MCDPGPLSLNKPLSVPIFSSHETCTQKGVTPSQGQQSLTSRLTCTLFTENVQTCLHTGHLEGHMATLSVVYEN